MEHFDQELYRLLQQVVHSRHLEAKLLDLQEQCEVLRRRINELEEERQAEQEDVERLERHSLSSFLYKIMGKKEEKLDRERREAYEAAVRYDAAARELESVEQYRRSCEEELEKLAGCEARYEAYLKEKEEKLKLAEGDTAKKILELEETVGYTEQQEKEIKEAVQAASQALSTADQMLEALHRAEGWSTWDMLGGGLLTDTAKYEELDKVQDLAERLQEQLCSLKSELSDVDIEADIFVQVDDFLYFADYFFDGVFADMVVRDQILVSLKQAEKSRNQIQLVFDWLRTMEDSLEKHIAALKEERERCILQG